jgi:hypothetical protein
MGKNGVRASLFSSKKVIGNQQFLDFPSKNNILSFEIVKNYGLTQDRTEDLLRVKQT